MENKKKVILGFDIGIASVGWCVTELDSLKIVKHGVRTFNTVDDPKNSKLLNEERREARSHRRQVNRKKTLKRDFIKALIECDFINDLKFDRHGKFVQQFRDQYINNPKWRQKIDQKSQYESMGGIFDLREQGLTRELTKKELISVLYWYINHRGFKYTVSEKKEDKKKNEVAIELEKTFPIKNQIAQFKKYRFLNGTFNQKFHKNDYIKEIKAIFKNIKSYQLPEMFFKKENKTFNFEEGFFNFFERQRSFEQGPGNKKTFSKYGIRDYDENGKLIKKYQTIWEKTVGKCSLYPEEYRAPKYSFSSELFNLLNDLNNIVILKNDHQAKLTPKQKIAIIKISLNVKTNFGSIVKYLKKEFDLENESFIYGMRSKKKSKKKGINADLEMEITSFKTYHAFYKIFKKINYQYQFEDLFNANNEYQNENLINQLSQIFSKTTLVEKRLEQIKEINVLKKLNQIELQQIAEIKLKAGNHAFSFKALNELIKVMLVKKQNSQEIIWRKQKDVNIKKYDMDENKILSNQWIDDLIITPTVKRALLQTVKIFNALNEYCGKNNLQISDIVIEMAREKNNEEKRENETNYQKMRENQNKKIDVHLNNYPEIIKTNTLRRKIWLWMQQKTIDVYTGEVITIKNLIYNQKDFEEDHIIPYSLCFDNSMNNFVLTHKKNNQQKGKRTPFQYMNKNAFDKMKYEWNKWYLAKDEDRQIFYAPKKYNYLISEKDFSNPKEQIGFIGRNLVDTRYVTKEFFAVLEAFKEINDLKFKIKSVNGKMTSFIRKQLRKKQLFLKNPVFEKEELKLMKQKDRIWYGHHAQDAYICTFLGKWYKDQKRIEKFVDTDLLNKTDSQNFREKKEAESEKKFYEQKFDEIDTKINDVYKQLNAEVANMLFSRRIEKKSNTKLFNETLYRGKKSEKKGQIQKFVYMNLLEMKKEDCKKYFDIHYSKNKTDSVLMKHRNKKMYAQLCEIYKEHEEEKNPFKKYAENNEKLFVVCFINNKEITVKKIQIVKELKDRNNVVFAKKDSNVSKNRNSFYDSMKWIRIHLYLTKNNRKKLIPINALNCKFISKPVQNEQGNWINKSHFQIDQDKLNLQKQKLDIPLENKPIDIFCKGEILKNKQKLYYVVGTPTKNKIEIKWIDRNYSLLNAFYIKHNNPKKTKSIQIFKSINTFEYEKINLDYLGFKI